MADDTNYSNIENPYDALLDRGGVGGINAQDSTSSNGSVQEATVKSDGAMSDIWIKNFIRSENWHPKKTGFYIDGQTGKAEFSDVFIAGGIQALTGNIGGFTITATSLSATSGGNTTTISSGSTAFLAGPTGFPTVTITQAGLATFTNIAVTGGNIGGTTTLGTGTTTAATLGSAIDASGHFADNAISTATSTILGSFTFGASGALQIGTYVYNSSGDVKISPAGILGRDKLGNTTFSINGTTGVAVLNGLVVGTNVGLGTAQDSSGVTTIIGNTVTTGYVNALSIIAGSVAAENITGTYLTGKTIRTNTVGNIRLQIDPYDGAYYANSVSWLSSTNTLLAHIAGGTDSSLNLFNGGETITMRLNGSNNIDVVGHFTPENDASYDLGYSFRGWRAGYFTDSLTLNGTTITDWPSSGASALSAVTIDADKDWATKNITNIGNITQITTGAVTTNWLKATGTGTQVGASGTPFGYVFTDILRITSGSSGRLQLPVGTNLYS